MTDEHLCVCCPTRSPTEPPRHYDEPQVCTGCRQWLSGILTRLPDDYATLPAAFPKSTTPQSNGSKIRSTPQGSEPLNWWPFDLMLPANQGTRPLMARGFLGLDPDQTGDLSAATILDTEARDWNTYLNEHLPEPYVWSLCRWLGHRLEWACDHHPAIDEFAAVIYELSRSITSAARTDHGKGERIGNCPARMRDETYCNTPLRVDPYVDQIQCGRCGSRWDRRKGEWLKLRADQIAMKKETAA